MATALVNQLHGLLLEYGVTVSRGRVALRRALATFLAEERGMPLLRQLLAEQLAKLADWDHRLETVTTHIEQESTAIDSIF